ncbi:protein D3-like isoform X2 [Cydia splendana]|uniref:protein D3-like isoform X2 n=1 Tax=Cydia splendana TaxID=1100963 RepID=UPI002144408C
MVYKITMSLVARAFESSKIVPDVIPTAPTATIGLKYPSGVEAAQGNELTPTQVKEQPTVTYEADANAFYTLVFTDPDNYDGPEPVYREWHHWLVGNIPGNNVASGEVLSGYIGSGPPEGTGIHRYVYILYKQPGKLSFDEPRLTNKSIDGRAAFSTKKFAEKYNLGAPVAGNFYRAQFDAYVPLLYKSLGV